MNASKNVRAQVRYMWNKIPVPHKEEDEFMFSNLFEFEHFNFLLLLLLLLLLFSIIKHRHVQSLLKEKHSFNLSIKIFGKQQPVLGYNLASNKQVSEVELQNIQIIML